MRFAELAATSEAVRATRSRKEKVAALAATLSRTAPHETAAAARFAAGDAGRVLGIGWAALRGERVAPAATATLEIAEVDAALAEIAGRSGAGSQAAKRDALLRLLGRATAPEQELLTGLVLGELRQGALQSIVADALGVAADAPATAVRRALMLDADLGAVAHAALHEGRAALDAFTLTLFRPVAPMLASTAPDVAAALEKTGPAAVETKLDGARVQIHRDGGEVAVYSRTGDAVTARVPELVEAALALDATAVVLDGEAIALRPDGRPHPFQVTGSRFGSSRDVAAQREKTPLTPMLFDLLHLDGADLLDEPGHVRAEALGRVVPLRARIPRAVPDTPDAAAELMRAALGAGHEGVVVKALDAPYAAGRRGSAWVKVKPVHTLDLVVLAAEWGHGRRTGKLSNLHLGARSETPGGGFVMLGKTFKGLTDELLAWQTDALLALAVARERHVVHVRPELVVEIGFDGVQTSSRYPGGVALRFARVLRYRPDKRADEADTLGAVLAFRDGD